MESRITPSPPPPSTWQWSSIVAIVLLFKCQKPTNWASRLGGAGSSSQKIPWQGEQWGGKIVIEWGAKSCPWNPCMGKRRKIGCKGKTNNPVTQSKTEVGTHISMGGNFGSQSKLGLSSWHELHFSLPLQVLLILKLFTPWMHKYLFSLLCCLLPQQPRNKL